MKNEMQTITYTGKFLGFTTLDGYKLKYFRLLTKDGEFIIKIPKEERLHFYKTLQAGDNISTTVTECFDNKKGLTKRKAISIDKTNDRTEQDQKDIIKILVCSECKGSSQLVRQLQDSLPNPDRVIIKMTGCMKRCKQAPNLTIVPLKRSFSAVKDITPILDLLNQ